MIATDSTSFTAGQECGARTAAVVARFAAFELIGCSRWWNRWKHRLMARALVAYAEEMELAVDGGRPTTVLGVATDEHTKEARHAGFLGGLPPGALPMVLRTFR